MSQDFGAVFGDQDGVFKVGRPAAVTGQNRPAVWGNVDGVAAERHHRLDSDCHTFTQPRTGVRPAIIRDVGVFVNLMADAMTDQIADDAIIMRV